MLAWRLKCGMYFSTICLQNVQSRVPVEAMAPTCCHLIPCGSPTWKIFSRISHFAPQKCQFAPSSVTAGVIFCIRLVIHLQPGACIPLTSFLQSRQIASSYSDYRDSEGDHTARDFSAMAEHGANRAPLKPTNSTIAINWTRLFKKKSSGGEAGQSYLDEGATQNPNKVKSGVKKACAFAFRLKMLVW